MSSRRKSRRPSLKGSLNPSKRHRDRVNVELDNLARLLPFPPDVIAKLDKLSVLRLSASYLRTKNFFKGLNGFEKKNKPTTAETVLDDFEKNGKLSNLLLEALDGFLMVLTQEGELFYASETISDYLGVSQASVIHQDFLRFVHADDQKLLKNNLKLVPSPPEQKIRDITDDEDKPDEDESEPEENTAGLERSFVCRFKCILNTNAGFFKPFKCHGRLREVDVPELDIPKLALFLICSPLEISTTILEVRMKSMLFCTKNKLDLTFVDIDQKGKQIVGYTKKDITAQSSYCMMHYDDIPILQGMHRDLLNTGKCQGTFRWMNKHAKWQWLSGTAQVILKNNQPDFVITTNKPLTDEEGEEEVRRRERELGLVPTSPATMLSHLQIGDMGSPVSAGQCDTPAADTNPPRLTHSAGPSTSAMISPDPSSFTSCASEVLTPDDLSWDLDADLLFEASGVSLDNNPSLADLDDIGKGDLVGEILHLDVNDLTFNEPLLSEGTAPPTTTSSYPVQGSAASTAQYATGVTSQQAPIQHASRLTSPLAHAPHTGGLTAPQGPSEHSSGLTSPQGPGQRASRLTSPQAPPWPPAEQKPTPGMLPNELHFATPLYPVSPNQQRPGNNPSVTLANAVSAKYGNPGGPRAANYGTPAANYGTPHNVSPSGRPVSAQQNGIPPSSSSCTYVNQPGMRKYANPTPSSRQGWLAVNPRTASQCSLLQVQTDASIQRSQVKSEPGRSNSSGYYCNTGDMRQQGMSGMPGITGMVGNGVSGLSAQVGANNRYQNRLVNHGSLPAWSSAPPSPYSSGSSSSSSYADALHVQFSPTEVLTSPFASPRDDNDYNHGDVPGQSPLSGSYPTSGTHRVMQQPRTRRQPSFPQPYVNIPEISPVDTAVHATPISAQNAGLANW